MESSVIVYSVCSLSEVSTVIEKPLQKRWEELEKGFKSSGIIPLELIELMEVAFFYGCCEYHEMVLSTDSLQEEEMAKKISGLFIELEEFRKNIKTRIEDIKQRRNNAKH